MSVNAQHCLLQPSDIVLRIDGHWLRRYAQDFLAAAIGFTPPSDRFSPVPYYLTCRSIELALKSFLFSTGLKKQARKALTHDLQKILGAAEERGLADYMQISDRDRNLIRKANKPYFAKEFEYFERLETVYDPQDFELTELASFAHRLLEAIDAPVRASVIQQSE